MTGALVSMSPGTLECRWAGWLASRAKQPIVGFGSSDCSCSGHLFYLGSSTHAEEIRTLSGDTHTFTHKYCRDGAPLCANMDETLDPSEISVEGGG